MPLQPFLSFWSIILQLLSPNTSTELGGRLGLAVAGTAYSSSLLQRQNMSTCWLLTRLSESQTSPRPNFRAGLLIKQQSSGCTFQGGVSVQRVGVTFPPNLVKVFLIKPKSKHVFLKGSIDLVAIAVDVVWGCCADIYQFRRSQKIIQLMDYYFIRGLRAIAGARI